MDILMRIFILCNNIFQAERLPNEILYRIGLSLGCANPLDWEQLQLVPQELQQMMAYKNDILEYFVTSDICVNPHQCIPYDAFKCLQYSLDSNRNECEECIFIAARNPNPMCLDLLLAAGYQHNPRCYIEVGADIRLLQNLSNRNFKPIAYATAIAAKYGRIDALEWMLDHDFPKCGDAYAQAASNAHLNTLQWLKDHNFPRRGFEISTAAFEGHFDIIRWLYDNGFDMSHDACKWAAKHADPTILLWLLEHNFPHSEEACTIATHYQSKEALKILISQHFPITLSALVNCIQNADRECWDIIFQSGFRCTNQQYEHCCQLLLDTPNTEGWHALQ